MKCSTVSVAVFTFLCLLAGSSSASAQLAPIWKPHERGSLEKYDNPPMYIFRLETSPRMISPHGLFISHQVNVDANGQNIIGDAANECSISVDPTDSTRMT